MFQPQSYITLLRTFLSPFKPLNTSPVLGRWNSVVRRNKEKQRENWEIYVDMANYDNCCCSFTNKRQYKTN